MKKVTTKKEALDVFKLLNIKEVGKNFNTNVVLMYMSYLSALLIITEHLYQLSLQCIKQVM